ncbi:MAG TPA: CBS domain-containing protein [Blastocatellia bacterium]|nr:CBS domain-containing protein [Blastocatellia bacterium]
MERRYANYERSYERGNYGGRGREERGLIDRATDEVKSWFGDERAERRRRMDERNNWRDQNPLRDLRAGDVMTRDVVCVRPDEPLDYAAQMMQECDCGALPVIDRAGRLLGMITDRDITIRAVARGLDVRRARVGDCMTDEAFACNVNDAIEDCMRAMSRHQVRRIPIVDDRDRVVGIVSQSDLARHAGEHPGYGERRAMANVLCAVSEPTHAPYR